MSMFESAMFLEGLEKLKRAAHNNSRAKGFWTGPENDNIPTKIALLHSELSELLEAWRDGETPTEKDVRIVENAEVRQVTNIEEEVADVFIRLLDLCGRLDIDLGRVTMAKMEYNASRPHMHGGKKV